MIKRRGFFGGALAALAAPFGAQNRIGRHARHSGADRILAERKRLAGLILDPAVQPAMAVRYLAASQALEWVAGNGHPGESPVQTIDRDPVGYTFFAIRHEKHLMEQFRKRVRRRRDWPSPGIYELPLRVRVTSDHIRRGYRGPDWHPTQNQGAFALAVRDAMPPARYARAGDGVCLQLDGVEWNAPIHDEKACDWWKRYRAGESVGPIEFSIVLWTTGEKLMAASAEWRSSV